jgi:hypothetical protein
MAECPLPSDLSHGHAVDLGWLSLSGKPCTGAGGRLPANPSHSGTGRRGWLRQLRDPLDGSPAMRAVAAAGGLSARRAQLGLSQRWAEYGPVIVAVDPPGLGEDLGLEEAVELGVVQRSASSIWSAWSRDATVPPRRGWSGRAGVLSHGVRPPLSLARPLGAGCRGGWPTGRRRRRCRCSTRWRRRRGRRPRRR